MPKSMLRIALAAGTLLPVYSQTIEFAPGSTLPLVQLTGEHFQIQSGSRLFSELTAAQTLSRYGALGTDLGYSVVYPDKVVLLFGDTIGAYQRDGRYILGGGGPSGTGDSIATIPNTDWSPCRYIPDIDQQLEQGAARPSARLADCPNTRFYLNPTRTPNQPLYKDIAISGLQADESQATFRVPTGAFHTADRLHMFYVTRIQDARPDGAFALQSILARSDQPPSVWSDATPPTFSRLYTVSSHPPVADPRNPPPEAADTGKFMYNAPVVMEGAALAAANLTSGLPAALQAAPSLVFVVGTSFRVNRSNLYLAAFAASDAAAGTARWFYWRGANQWTANEREAVAITGNLDAGLQSVAWNAALRRFVLLRSREGNVLAQFAAAPWGPWSDPVAVFERTGSWARKLLHRPGQDQIQQSLIPIFNPNLSPAALPNEDTGIAYAPNLIDKSTQNADGSVTLYYTMSTWNPYQVFLMSTTFRAVTVLPQVSAVNAASFDAAALAPGSIASVFGSGFAAGIVSAPSANLPLSLDGVSVTVRDSAAATRTAPLFFVAPRQINLVLPADLAAGAATLTVLRNNTPVATSSVTLTTVAPAVFTANADGRGAAAAYFATAAAPYTLAFACPAPGACATAPFPLADAAGPAVLVLYGTGFRNHSGLTSVRVTVGTTAGTVLYAGPHSEYQGLDQLNVQLAPALRGRGEVDVVLTVNQRGANTVRVAFR